MSGRSWVRALPASIYLFLTAASVKEVKKRVPMASDHLEKTREIFKEHDKDSDDALSFNELHQALIQIGNKITTLPAVCTRLLSRC